MKRYVVIILAILLAVVLDAFIFTVLLGEPYSRVPGTYHVLNILALSCALAVLGDMIFKADVLR
ncbi:MAG: hypothetical protein K1X65_13620 [Caldilineales bacterium]|nr:hypothetical protein [Caldilineales bacterium]MCW5857047.1 hypothetical protein [Caldilineales bacterium]